MWQRACTHEDDDLQTLETFLQRFEVDVMQQKITSNEILENLARDPCWPINQRF